MTCFVEGPRAERRQYFALFDEPPSGWSSSLMKNRFGLRRGRVAGGSLPVRRMWLMENFVLFCYQSSDRLDLQARITFQRDRLATTSCNTAMQRPHVSC
jgi:hypothetical protein